MKRTNVAAQVGSSVLTAPNPLKIAIVLNGNARAVNESIISDLRKVLRDETLFVSHSLEQAKFIARHIVNKRYDVVLCGGGDGTFTRCVTDILDLHPEHTPVFGVLPLGTGNAIGTSLGCSSANLRGLITDLARARQSDAQAQLPLLRVEGRVAPFAGVGLDSQVLEDYNRVKDQLKGLGEGGLGYFLAVTTKSLWRFLLKPKPFITVRNEGLPAQRINVYGQPIGRPIPRGGIIYQGDAAIAAASAIPYYGLGMKAFPQALKRKDRFQLRVGTSDPQTILPRIPQLFNGTFSDPRLHDYYCTAISIHADEPIPFQVGGDEVGRRTSVFIEMTSIRAVWGENAELGFAHFAPPATIAAAHALG